MNITRYTTDFALNLTTIERRQYALIAAWVLAMIALPILKWTFGTDIIPTAVTFALMIQFSAVLYISINAWGLKSALFTFLLVAIITWSIEGLGSSTGFPFGGYDYTPVLQPKVAGVPLLIPLAWFMMLPSSWAVAHVLLGKHRNRVYSPALYALVSALAITAWDLFLDPQMVAWGFWIWDEPGAYFGIPLANYAGWLLTGIIVTVLVRPDKRDLPIVPLITIYAVVWFLQSFGQAIFWGQTGPALVGSIGMGILLFSALFKLRQEANNA
ncbi:MAG: carotenoid biosynthesis protein [Aggregatilineales bacterium]